MRIKIVIGLHVSMEFLEEAKADESLVVYAFEPNSEIVKSNYNKFEIPKNYIIFEKAVSNINGLVPFNICSLDSCSSLMDWGNGPTMGEMNKIEVECVRMDTFIEEIGIDEIEFVSIDTQGSDLDVLNGFGNKIGIVKEGICESLSEDTEWKLYDNQPSFSEFVAFFDKNGYDIDWKYNSIGGCPKNEVNIHFKKM
jgi:FkbM family methyltransferase